MRGRFSSSRAEAEAIPETNLTPLIDVVFVVLICFILMAPMLELDKVQLAAAPKARVETTTLSTSPISIHVAADDSIFVNHRPVSLQQLDSECFLLHSQYPEAHPQLFHDKKGSFGTYQSIKNALETAGFTSIDVILQPG